MTSVEATRLTLEQLHELAGLEDRPLFERIRVLRTTLGLKQRELAEAVGVNVRTVKGWESPEMPRGAPDIVSAGRLSGLVGGAVPAGLFMVPRPLEETIAQEILRKVDLIMRHLGIEEER